VIDTLVVLTPLRLAVAPTSHVDSVDVGAVTAASDSSAVSLTGAGADTTAWSAVTAIWTWITITTNADTGSGQVRWDRDPTGLAAGVYVDTITVTADGAIDSPAWIIDSLVLVPPLTLAVVPTGRTDSAIVGTTSTLPDSADVLLTGTGAATATWSTTHGEAAWVSVTTAGGTGSGVVHWVRDPTALTVGTYVDTISVTAPGAIGSPATVVDTLVILIGAATAALDPVGTRDSLSIGTTAFQPDSATLTLTGGAADTTQWTATNGAASWLTLTTTSGTGSGTVRWQRSAVGLGLGISVDTITVITSAGERAVLVDSLEIIPAPLTVSAPSRTGSAVSGAVISQADSALLTFRGVGNTDVTWTATHGDGTWLTLTTASGTGDGTVRWVRDPSGLRPGVYVDTVLVTTSRNDSALVVDTLTLTAPLVAEDCAAAELLGTNCLDDVQRRYLDLTGNADAVYNLGDLVALLRRAGAAVSEDRRR
jgi:hypothetical protein